MKRKGTNVYVRDNGDRVAVFDRPVGQQMRFTAHKRTAVDGRVWWSVYDNEKDCWQSDAKYPTRKECEQDILSALQRGRLPFKDTMHGDGFKKGEHTFIVDVRWGVGRSYEVTAKDRMEAERKVWERIDNGDVCVWTDNFEALEEDVDVRTSGEETRDGGVTYY